MSHVLKISLVEKERKKNKKKDPQEARDIITLRLLGVQLPVFSLSSR